MSYLTLSSQEKHLFYFVHTFTRIRQHYFSKYWGNQCMGRPPTSNFRGTVPPVPPGLRPWPCLHLQMHAYNHKVRRCTDFHRLTIGCWRDWRLRRREQPVREEGHSSAV